MVQETSKRSEAETGPPSPDAASGAPAPATDRIPPPLPAKSAPPPGQESLADRLRSAGPPPPSAPSQKPAAQATVPASQGSAAGEAHEPLAEPVADDNSGEAARRRPAKRRAAGPPRTQIAANDDLPSIGGLIFALHEKPSQRPMQVAAIASVIWALCGLLLGWAMLAPEFQRLPTVMDVLARPTAIALAATIVLPIAMFWFIALLIWRAHELKLMSSAMTEVAIRLAEPDRMAEQQIASVGQAVRRQVNHMNEAVSRALGRAGELEALVHNEVASLERSYTQNENRIRGLLEELAGERNALLHTSERVSHSLKELGTDIPSLVDKLSDQQVKLARFIEQAGQNLVALETSIAQNATSLASSVGTQARELNTVLTDRTAELSGLLEHRSQEIASAIQGGRDEIDGRLAVHTDELQQIFGGFAGGLGQALTERTDQLRGMLETTSTRIEGALAERTEGLQAVLEEYTRALDATMAARQQGLDQQLLSRTQALDDAFAERLKLFDDTVLRSTIAIDGTVADKARMLSKTLENHANDLSQTLGQQASLMDEQIMNGVHAVRRASENVTRQSVQAIDGLANQSEMLRNLSENLVNQISSVTNRFDQQGQTIMRAAAALETANFRIDQNLQARQTELARTLEHLSGKAEDIDRVMRGYPAALEGTVNALETRAISAGEKLVKGVEERSRAAFTEMDRLRSAADGEADRAVAELRNKFSTISQEVSQHIGTIENRFSSSYDDMRERAHRTLSDIESEQSRLKAELERLPEATRASAEHMRLSLQEQLRALEQLSSLTQREALRTDVATPASPLASAQAAAAPAQPRAISSITQTLATELAARNSRAATAAPAQGSATADAQRGDGWKLGDLLARASQEDVGQGEIDLAAYARALDQTTASAIWSRFRAGQRGIMVRSIYSVEGRSHYDDVSRRYASDGAFHQKIDRYLVDFQRFLKEADQRDPTGRLAQSHVVSDHGRAYLFLAHATGHLA